MLRRVCILGAAACLISTSLAACGGNGDTGRPQARTYSQDGYLGITDVNPNHPLTPGYHTYQKDTDMIRSTIQQVPGVRDSFITLDGLNARVRVDVNPQLTFDEQERLGEEVYRRLIFSLPRYNFNVSVDDGK